MCLCSLPISMQAILFCHDKISTKDLYIPKAYFPRSAQDPVDIIHSNSDYNMAGPAVAHVDAPLPRDVPSGRKENAMIVFVQRTNRPLVSDAPFTLCKTYKYTVPINCVYLLPFV